MNQESYIACFLPALVGRGGGGGVRLSSEELLESGFRFKCSFCTLSFGALSGVFGALGGGALGGSPLGLLGEPFGLPRFLAGATSVASVTPSASAGVGSDGVIGTSSIVAI